MMSVFEYSEVYSPKYDTVVEITKKHEDAHWTEREIKLQQDIEQYKTGKLTQKEKNLIEYTLRLFTQSDVNVGRGFYDILIPTFRNNEVRNMFGSFACREGTHQRGYALFTDSLGFNSDFYHDFLQFDEMRAKHDFQITNDIDDTLASRVKYLAKQTMVEGVSLFATFAMLLNFDRYGKMQGMSDLNRWSIIDESLHVEGNSHVFRLALEEMPEIVTDSFKKDIYDTARQLVSLEDCIIEQSFAVGESGDLTEEQMKMYIRYVCDYRLKQLGLKPNWGIEKNPLTWIDDLLTGAQHGNFFEREIVEYSKDNFEGEYEGGY